ncbi:MAG: beta-glucosidase-like glycosyl hydrolase [Xanthobacteraceae bacterium]|nr:beta-glucosidase-like glycosyl hydrolase [Xanthobacteraceae bacterium]
MWPAIVSLVCAIALFAVAYDWRAPLFASVRGWLLPALIVLPIALIGIELRTRWWRAHLAQAPRARRVRILSIASSTLAVLALVCTVAIEAQFQFIRRAVLRTNIAEIEPLGRHIVVGYRRQAELRQLIERRGIAGVFVAPLNVHRRTGADTARDIAGWQATRRDQGLAPLWISADQEGGVISRLSPPLTRQLPLSHLVANYPEGPARQAAIAGYAAQKGRELRDLGVNLNLAPVLDLNHGVVSALDRHSMIYRRAISNDPAVVANVAGAYCAGLDTTGVRCTLKHFPGLGRLTRDTHLQAVDLDVPVATLAASDWMPFRSLMQGDRPFVMLGHVRVPGLDAERPASFSQKVISGLLRTEWGFDGVLITDDFSMGAVYYSRNGIAGATLEALNAGVDLVLLSYDTDQYFPIMYRLLQASRSGALRPETLAKSAARLDRAGNADRGRAAALTGSFTGAAP